MWSVARKLAVCKSWSIWRGRNASFWENAFARVVEVIYRGNVLLKEWREAHQENGKF
jgi:hypothetical protein